MYQLETLTSPETQGHPALHFKSVSDAVVPCPDTVANSGSADAVVLNEDGEDGDGKPESRNPRNEIAAVPCEDARITSNGVYVAQSPIKGCLVRDSSTQMYVLKTRRKSGEYGRICETPRAHTPESTSSSSLSMRNNNENITPPPSPSALQSEGTVNADGIGRLSLQNERVGPEKSAPVTSIASTSGKRPASSDLPRESSKHPARFQSGKQFQGKSGKAKGDHRAKREVQHSSDHRALRQSGRRAKNENSHSDPVQIPFGTQQCCHPIGRDSGYGSTATSRQNTYQEQHCRTNDAATEVPSARTLATVHEQKEYSSAQKTGHGIGESPAQERHSSLVLQPESSPISPEQFVAEVKGIYAGLVMVEAKCMNIDHAQAADTNAHLEREQWQALIALHRTLLYEHHDFLMATQHPSASKALNALASKYSMPARMWRHGIHAFLEVLRHRRPESQEYMLAFIYLAYQMMALLFETVPAFLDTWIECLGDLARYRMAIEEEKEAYAAWSSVAGRWYRMATDKKPTVGRLNHHLGILERPGLCKLYLYTKALSCVVPFLNAKESMITLCEPLAKGEQAGQHSNQTAELRIVTLYALILSSCDEHTTRAITGDAIAKLESQASSRLPDVGPELVVIATGFVIQLGNSNNAIWQLLAQAVGEDIQTARPSAQTATGPVPDTSVSQLPSSLATTYTSPLVIEVCYRFLNSLMPHRKDRQSVSAAVSSVHAVLVWLHGIYSLRSRINEDTGIHTCGLLLSPEKFSWGELSDYLNHLSQANPIGARTVEFARQGMFLVPERPEDVRPLSEDFILRGLLWSQFYYPPDWFDGSVDDNGRAIETPRMHKARIERLQWLGLYLAFRVEHLNFDVDRKSFFVSASVRSQLSAEYAVSSGHNVKQYRSAPTSRSSTTVSAESDSEGYTVVKPTSRKAFKRQGSLTLNSTRSKSRLDNLAIKIVDEEMIRWQD